MARGWRTGGRAKSCRGTGRCRPRVARLRRIRAGAAGRVGDRHCVGRFAFAVCAITQAVVIAAAREAPNLASTFNISAFNLGNALGAGLSAAALSAGLSLWQFHCSRPGWQGWPPLSRWFPPRSRHFRWAAANRKANAPAASTGICNRRKPYPESDGLNSLQKEGDSADIALVFNRRGAPNSADCPPINM